MALSCPACHQDVPPTRAMEGPREPALARGEQVYACPGCLAVVRERRFERVWADVPGTTAASLIRRAESDGLDGIMGTLRDYREGDPWRNWIVRIPEVVAAIRDVLGPEVTLTHFASLRIEGRSPLFRISAPEPELALYDVEPDRGFFAREAGGVYVPRRHINTAILSSDLKLRVLGVTPGRLRLEPPPCRSVSGWSGVRALIGGLELVLPRA